MPPPAAGPEHGGGAGFSPYDPGDIGTGPDPLGPLLPTALGLGVPPVQFESGINGAGERQPAAYAHARPWPGRAGRRGDRDPGVHLRAGSSRQLTERQALDARAINGVDQGNLTLGPSADARITFIDEVAQFQNTLGVYLIDADGTIHEPQDRVPADRACRGRSEPAGRRGRAAARCSRATRSLLSELYDPGELQEGQQFGLFYITEGWTLNGARLNGELEFQPAASIDDPTPRLFSTVGGDVFEIAGTIFHSADPTRTTALANPLNAGGDVQVISGLEADIGGLTITFEDLALSSAPSDDDFNDTTILVDLLPVQQLNFAFVPTVAPDIAINDPTAAISPAPPSQVVGRSRRRRW